MKEKFIINIKNFFNINYKSLIHFFFLKNYIFFFNILFLLNNHITKNKLINLSFKKSYKFVKKCSKSLLFTKIPYKINFIPNISIITPVYNREKTIKRAIRSIQNQDKKEFEIILVNDYSIDNTLIIIKKLMNEDHRIKIINNKKNMGILYSRSIGVLFSNGNYIFPLDSDDMLLSNDVFKFIYNEIKDNNIDILRFKSISIWNLHDFFVQKNLKVIGNYKNIIYERQPKLGESAINKYIIWGKCIKAKIFKKAIRALNKKRYSQYMTFVEDAITFYIICQFSEISKSILKYGILKINYSNSAMHSRNDTKVNIYKLKYIEIILEFSRNSFKAKEGVIGIIIKLLKKKILGNL